MKNEFDNVKFAAMIATHKYLGGESVETITEEIDKLMNFDDSKSYNEKISGVSAGLDVMSTILLLRQFENNPKDMRVIVEKIKDVAEMAMDCYE